jgi:hypothetical protein
MRASNCCLGLVIVGALSGCTYSPVLHSHAAQFGHSGLVYALPKAQFQIDVVRKVVSAQDVNAAKKASDAATASVAAADKAAADAKAVLAAAQANVDASTTVDPVQTREKLESQKALATILLRARSAELEVAKLQAGEAATRLAQATANLGKMEQSVVLKALSAAPDHRYRYAVVLDPSMVRDDNLKLTTASGLLNSTVNESTGQAGSLLVNLVSSLAGAKGPKTARSAHYEAPAAGCEPFALSRTFDPTDMAELVTLAQVLEQQSQGALQLVHEGRVVDVTAPPGSPAASGIASKFSDGRMPGLLYRAPRLTTIEVKAKKSPVCISQAQPAYASLSSTVPDATTAYLLPIEAGAFTKSKVEYAFKDGMPITYNTDRPSQAVAVARLPVEIMKAIVEVPASILKLRVDYDSTANALTDAETKALKAQLDLLKAQRELEITQSADQN